MILPGATLGVLGGGQLGRMFTIAARTMGYRVLVLDPGADSPAGAVADEQLRADYADREALKRISSRCTAVTVEFENVPAESLDIVASGSRLCPGALAVRVTQNRILEKRFIRDIGLPTTAFREVHSTADLGQIQDLSPPLILKRAALGYDGKGQIAVRDRASAISGFAALGSVSCILEEQVDLALEVSVILARSHDGQLAVYPVAENIHRRGILDVSVVPARISRDTADRAVEFATSLSHALGYCGVLAVEFFITREGELLVNEVAPRPHNSGHYTLDACVTSQFDQQVRLMCGLPPGDPRLLSPVAMGNLLGDLWYGEAPNWARILGEPAAKLHLYGKREARPGRKMGHFCVLDESVERCVQRVGALRDALVNPRSRSREHE